MRILGTQINLKRIAVPYYNAVMRFNHIVPMPIGLQNSFLIDTPLDSHQVILVCDGHVRGVVNPKLFPFLSEFAKKWTLLYRIEADRRGPRSISTSRELRGR